MAGANNRSLKAHGFKAREIKKIRAGYGIVSSAKDAAIAAQRVGVPVPARLHARLATSAPVAASGGSDRERHALRNEVKRIVERSFGEATTRTTNAIRSQGELTEKSREVKLARKLTDNDARIMQVAQAGMAHFMKTGAIDPKIQTSLTAREWARAERLMARL